MREYVVSDDRHVWNIQITRSGLGEDWLLEEPEHLIYGAAKIQFTWIGDGTTEPTDGPRPASPGDVLRLYLALKAGAKALPRTPAPGYIVE